MSNQLEMPVQGLSEVSMAMRITGQDSVEQRADFPFGDGEDPLHEMRCARRHSADHLFAG